MCKQIFNILDIFILASIMRGAVSDPIRVAVHSVQCGCSCTVATCLDTSYTAALCACSVAGGASWSGYHPMQCLVVHFSNVTPNLHSLDEMLSR